MKANIAYNLLHAVLGGIKCNDVEDYILSHYALKHDKDSLGKNEGPNYKDKLESLYLILTVMDSKASALMRLNGVTLAAAAFLLSHTLHNDMGISILIGISAICAAISIVLCLNVVSVDWPFLGLVEIQRNADETKSFNFAEEFTHLICVCHWRQSFYRKAWSISLLNGLLFIVAIVLFFFYDIV